MIALAMGYSIATGLLVTIVAVAVEGMVQRRIPTRHIWSAAMGALLLLPPALMVRRAAAGSRTVSAAVMPRISAPTRPAMAAAAGHLRQTAPRPAAGLPMRHIGASRAAPLVLLAAGRPGLVLDRIALTLWGLASAATLLWMVGIVVYWRRMLRTLPRMSVAGVHAAISDDIGPATIGVLRTTVVLPRWVLALPALDRHLVLKHEREHVRAHDPHLLLCAECVLILTPWNPALWWCLLRLRRAIEMDCDARVVGAVGNARVYGRFLVRAAARMQVRPRPLAGLALLSGISALERRVRALAARRRPRRAVIVRGSTLSVACVAVLTLLPAPRLAPGAVVHRVRAVVPSAGCRSCTTRRAPSPADGVRGTPDAVRQRAPASASSSLTSAGPGLDTLDFQAPDSSLRAGGLDSLRRDLTGRLEDLATERQRLQVELARVSRWGALDEQERDARARRARTSDTLLQGVVRRLQGSRAALDSLALRLDQQRREMAGARARWDAAIGAMLDTQFRGGAGLPPDVATLWVVADSSGRVLQVIQDTTTGPAGLSLTDVQQRFGPALGGRIATVYVTSRMVAGRGVAIIWSLVR